MMTAQLPFDLGILSKFVNPGVMLGVGLLSWILTQICKLVFPKLQGRWTLLVNVGWAGFSSIALHAALWQAGELPAPRWAGGFLMIFATAVFGFIGSAGFDKYKDFLQPKKQV